MIDSSGRRFIQLLEPQRDEIYSNALEVAGSPAAAETCIQRAVRAAFRESEQGEPPRDFGPWLKRHLESQLQPLARPVPDSKDPPSVSEERMTVAMPADIWARLAAAIQIESVKIHGAKAVGDDSLLAYDPLLAPKKKQALGEDLSDGLNLSPWSRFILAATIVLIIGVVATVILTTRRAPPDEQTPTTQTHATQSASAPTSASAP